MKRCIRSKKVLLNIKLLIAIGAVIIVLFIIWRQLMRLKAALLVGPYEVDEVGV